MSKITAVTISLLRSPAFSLTFIATLALGAGLNGAMFAVVQGVLIRPLKNEHGDRLVYLQQSAPGIGFDNILFSVPEIQDYRASAKSLASIGEFSTMSFAMVGLGDPRQLTAGIVDGRYFEIIGLRPVLGRLLGQSDDGPNASGAVLLTHAFWSSLGADPNIIGRTVQLGVRAATVVGVLEPAPGFPEETEIFTNVVVSPHHLSATMVTDRLHRMTNVFGLLAPGATPQSANVELSALQHSQIAANRGAYEQEGRFAVRAVPLTEQMTVRARTSLMLLFATSFLVLLIACANVANLLLTRLLHHQRELAIRSSLGASQRSLRMDVLIESVILCTVGAVAASLVALPIARLVAAVAAQLTVRATDMPLDTRMLWFSLAVSVGTALLIAFIVPLPTGRARIEKRSARGTSLSAAARRTQRSLVMVQVAVSFVLVCGASLFVQSLMVLQREDSGMSPDRVLALEVPLVPTRQRQLNETFYRELERQIAALPGVRSVATGSMVPLQEDGGFFNNFEFAVEGAVMDVDRQLRANFRSVSPGYLATLGVPLLAGRTFNDDDMAESDDVVLISRNIADRLFPGREAVGRYLSWTDPRVRFGGVSPAPRRIVGVVGDVRERALDKPAEMIVYHPFSQEPLGGRIFVRTSGDPHLLADSIKAVIRKLAANQPIAVVGTLDEIRSEVIEPSRVTAMLIAALAIVALAIGSVGVFGVLSYSVGMRIREFGIRMAIGSTPHQVMLKVLTEGLRVGLQGIAVGTIGAVLFARLLTSGLYGVSFGDPRPFVGAAAILLAVTMAATLLPAWRAARVDPSRVLAVD